MSERFWIWLHSANSYTPTRRHASKSQSKADTHTHTDKITQSNKKKPHPVFTRCKPQWFTDTQWDTRPNAPPWHIDKLLVKHPANVCERNQSQRISLRSLRRRKQAYTQLFTRSKSPSDWLLFGGVILLFHLKWKGQKKWKLHQRSFKHTHTHTYKKKWTKTHPLCLVVPQIFLL